LLSGIQDKSSGFRVILDRHEGLQVEGHGSDLLPGHTIARRHRMTSYAKKTLVSLFAGAALTGGAAMPAQAATPQFQDGLVNVAVGDVSVLNNAHIGVVAQVAAQICGLNVGPVAVLGRAVDRSGATSTVCTVDGAPVTISNN
jgi:hypothetical protein